MFFIRLFKRLYLHSKTGFHEKWVYFRLPSMCASCMLMLRTLFKISLGPRIDTFGPLQTFRNHLAVNWTPDTDLEFFYLNLDLDIYLDKSSNYLWFGILFNNSARLGGGSVGGTADRDRRLSYRSTITLFTRGFFGSCSSIHWYLLTRMVVCSSGSIQFQVGGIYRKHKAGDGGRHHKEETLSSRRVIVTICPVRSLPLCLSPWGWTLPGTSWS